MKNPTATQKIFIFGLSLISILHLYACGAEEGLDSSHTEQTGSVLLGTSEGFFDMESGEVSIQPFSGFSQLAKNLILSRADMATLAATTITPTVALQGWFTNVYDERNHLTLLHQGTGPCLLNQEQATISDLVSRFRDFSDPTVTMAHGALQDSNSFIVKYQSLPPGESFCRSFSLINPSGANFSFRIFFEASGLTNRVPKSYIKSVNPLRFSYEASGTSVAIDGKGFVDNRPPKVLLGHSIQIPISTLTNTHLGLKVSSALDPLNSISGGEGFLTVVTNATANPNPNSSRSIHGPYVMQPQALRANVKLPAGFGNLTRKVFFRACQEDDSGRCAISSGCLINTTGSQVDAAEFAANIALSEVAGRPLSFHSMITTDTVANSEAWVWIGFDRNGNNRIDAGDLYANVPGVTVARGSVTDLNVFLGESEITLSETVAADCNL